MLGPRLIATKLFVPTPRRGCVERTRLDPLLERGVEGPLTLVSSPAGWGKTTLVSSWVHRTGRRVGWLALDERDREPSRLIPYLLAALERAAEGFSADAIDLEPSEADPETAAIAIVNALAELDTEAVLVLDDAHFLEGPAVQPLWQPLVEHAPPGLHLVLTTRVDPPLPLPRLRARGLLTEIRAPDLRFSGPEARALLQAAAGVVLDPELLGLLEARTEGWAAGLQMSALSLRRHQDPAELVRSLSGSHRFVLDYLIEEVLDRMPAARRQQLLDLSILSELSAPLVAAVAGVSDGQALLDELELENLFLVALDEQRRVYRFHHLFGTLLRHELETSRAPEHRRALHRRASEALRDAGDVPRAIDHALVAEDWPLAAQLVLSRSDTHVIRSELREVLDDLERFPDPQLDACPALLVRKAWYLDVVGTSPPLVRSLVRRARAALQEHPDPAAEAELDLLEGIALLERDRPAARAAFDRAAAGLEGSEGTHRAILHVNRALLEVAEDHLEPAQREVEELLELAQASDDPFTLLWARWYEAHLMLLAGAPSQTIARLLALYEPVRAQFGERLPRSTAVAMVTLAHAHLERGELDEAAQWIEQAQTLVDPKVAPADAGELVLTWARLEAHREPRGSGWREALACGQALATTYEHAGFRARLDAVRLRILLDPRVPEDPLPAARAWLESLEVDGSRHPLGSAKPAPSTRPSLVPLLRGRSLTRLGAHERAEAELLDLTQRAEAAGRRLCATEGRLALAELAVRRDAPSARDEQLRRALEHAAAELLVGPFLEHEPSLVTRALALAEDETTRALRARLASASRAPAPGAESPLAPHAVLVDPLSSRELEVLALVARGLSNAEVGRALFVAPSTVKKHLEHIYGKLDVRRRTQAVARARALGVLP